MELDFNTELIEQLLVKKAITDKKYLSLLSNMFDIRWYKSRDIGVLLDLSVLYYKKYNTTPDVKVLQALLQRSISNNRYISGKRPYENYHPNIEYATINNVLAETLKFDMQLPEDAINANITEYLKERALYFTFSDNMEYMEKHKSVDKCLETFEKFQKLAFTTSDLGLKYFDPDQMAKHWEFIMNPAAKVKTGWDGIDKYTNGGFLRDGKSLYIFMGQAGLGKSLFLSNITVNFLKQGLSVVVISLEMSENVYATRFDAHISKSNINRLMENSESAISRIKDFYKEHPDSQLYIKEYPPRSVKTSDIEIYLENLKASGEKFDVIVIDYLNLVLPNTKADTMYEAGLQVSEKLRALSYTYEAPVITAVQANSEGMNNEDIGMQHVSESRGIVHTADFLAGLYQTDDDRENGIINSVILKNRLGGQVGKVCNMQLDPENLILTDISFTNGVDGEIRSEADAIINNLQDISGDINSL